MDTKREQVLNKVKSKYTTEKQKSLGNLEEDFTKHAEKRNGEL